jgi:hypothetical protein
VTTPEETADELCSALTALAEPMYQTLDEIAARVVEVAATAPGGRLSEPLLQPVTDLVVPVVDAEPVVAGMGYVADVGAVDGQERYMLWWQRSPVGRVARLRLNFDPSSVDVYDYLEMEWFRLARAGRRRVVYGPYVDYSGSELYIVTMTVPVVVAGKFVGVAGVDLVVNELERRMVSLIHAARLEVLLVTAERRVLAANTPRWFVGDRLPEPPVVGSEFDAVAEVPGGTGWLVAVAAERSS